jgi:hypothetical protein
MSHFVQHPMKQLMNLMRGQAPDHRYMLYSVHDINVALLLQELSPSYNFTFIPYASSIITEVFENHDNLYVRLLFNGQVLPTNCQNPKNNGCPIVDFYNDISTRLIINDDAEVKNQCA